MSRGPDPAILSRLSNLEFPMTTTHMIDEPAGKAPVVAESDLVVVGGGPAGIAAAVAGARNGLSVTLLERYAYLGGLASGGMVLVLDDMSNGQEVTVRGLCSELIDRMTRMGLCVTPPQEDWISDSAKFQQWARWGVYDFHSHQKPQPICYASAFDPDGFKRASNAMVAEAGINLRARQGGDRRHRRPRRGGLRRRGFQPGLLHRDHGFPPRQCRHRRSRTFRV
jgi:choline dehydrogenase-like flavoprotein